jgi:ubiquinol-cytochrome c reductase iron-sulfur subunit
VTGADPGNHAARAAERRLERLVLACFGASTVTGLALLVVYIAGGQTQLEGVLLFVCLGGLGVGIVVWGQRLMSAALHVEPRGRVASDPAEIVALQDVLTEESGFSRRHLLIGGLGVALGGLAAALAIPVFSLGPAPDAALRTTSWRRGAKLAAPATAPVTVDTIPVGGLLTVFPDGDDADPNAATLLIRLEPAAVASGGASGLGATPAGFVAYSKICTHAGCPVGLYRSAQHILICPCHQSEFDVLAGARPVGGPAARPLPRLPIEQLPDGTFQALGDFPEPVGPSFWDMHR